MMQTPWYSTLESLLPAIGEYRNSVSMPFAPKSVPKPRKFDNVPVVMVVHTESNKSLVDQLYEGLHLLYEVTEGFKVLAFVSTPAGASSIQEFPWAVEHCMVEDDWDVLSDENWLIMALRRVQWAVDRWGVRFTFSPERQQDVVDALEFLGRVLRVPIGVRRDIAARVEASWANGNDDAYRGVRGAVERFEYRGIGGADISFKILGKDIRAVFDARHSASSRVAVLWGALPNQEELVEALRRDCWSIVRLSGDLSSITAKQKRRILGGASEALAPKVKLLLTPDESDTRDVQDMFDIFCFDESSYGVLTMKATFGHFKNADINKVLYAITTASKIVN